MPASLPFSRRGPQSSPSRLRGLAIHAHAARAIGRPASTHPGNLDIDDAGDFGDGIDSIVNDDDTSWKLFGGYRFNPYFSLEAAYINLGDLEERITASGSNGRYKVGIDGWSAMALGTLPLGGWELIGKAGYYFFDTSLSTNLGSPGSGSFIDSSSSDQDFVYGVGLGYTVLERLNMRVEYERFNLPTGDSDALWLSAAWRF